MSHLTDRTNSDLAHLAEISLDLAFDTIPLAILNDGRRITYAELSLQLMKQNLPSFEQFDWDSDLASLIELGERNSFRYNKHATIDEPFDVSPMAMSDPKKVYDPPRPNQRPDLYNSRITWQTMPAWIFGNAPNNWVEVYDTWKSNVLPLQWQWYLISSQDYLLKSMNAYIPDESIYVNRSYRFRPPRTNPFWHWYSNYIHSTFDDMNRVLRTLPIYNQEMCVQASKVTNLQILQWMITLMPAMDVPTVVYRYTKMNPQLVNANEDDVLTFRGFTSVSMNLLKTVNIVNWYGSLSPTPREMVLLEIHIPAGNRFIIVPSTENEIILPHFSKFRVRERIQLTEYITFISLDWINDPTECSREKNGIDW